MVRQVAPGSLAGVDFDRPREVRNLLGLGVAVLQALKMTTVIPAQALGLKSPSTLSMGAQADNLYFSYDLMLLNAWQGR